ncbi:50S ribosomal protein L25/general stress protein Ctc [Jeongeupia naejangsanensis]|uniref:Large ribosomal subunit protein bL25 n=1 Tax=Jeongeupia naejangsanensis TaxID=613195 RepID=A0ABS2BJT7_9NEIS|nr:50S ribosomal protein L25/general stress protein Ctc [Jeongeupia naejangsanensis]MBM3115877.1 50S ribosomal protein L25/general stress protein Ctc [Jeongeupia naejangsanensis]
MTYEIQAAARAAQGTGASRRLRKTGKLPGIVYGGSTAPLAIELDHNSMYYTLQEEAFHTALIKLAVDGKTEQVLLRSVNYHPFKQQVLHVDFQRVEAGSTVEVRVPLHFVGADTCEGVKLQGGSIRYILNDVKVRCLADKIPEFLNVDLSKMAVGNTIAHLTDIVLPEGVTLLALARGEDLAVASLNGAKAG